MMDSLRTFMDEMLDDQGRKEGFISDLLANLKTQPIPHIRASTDRLYNSEQFTWYIL